MKTLATQVVLFLKNRPDRKNFKTLVRFILVLFSLIIIFSLIFQFLMLQEGREFSFLTGIYWTLTVMSTLGFGDITFETDAGRLFSIIVLSSGTLFLLILFPFTFINFFYSPWMKAQEQAKVPRDLPEDIKNHVLITRFGPVTEALIKKLKRYNYKYAVIVSTLPEGLELRELGIKVLLGDLGDPETYKKGRVENAALVVTTESDVLNTNVAFTVRGINKNVPIIGTCNASASLDILNLAGCNHVLQLGEDMGKILSRRANGGDANAHVIGRFGELIIAEASVTGCSLVDKTLKETQLRQTIGVSVVGVWERGKFMPAQPDILINESTVLVLAGSARQMDAYNKTYQLKYNHSAPIVIVGGGRVGRATGRALAARNLDYRIVEKDPFRVKSMAKTIIGDAADLEVLKEAGIMDSPCVIITTHDDDVNVYLTIYCRSLRPDIQIITRTTHERNLASIHRAGADFVLSYASMGANAILNLLRRNDVLMVAEGLDLIRIKVPEALIDKSIADSEIRKETGCTIIAVKPEGGEIMINPEPSLKLEEGAEIILIGTVDAENEFFKLYKVDEK
ncbi:Trk system potassium uptake protein TrkA [Indibacter alkaliphilus LW1]|uniref:Trk system potassium uptake protein TrkA n=1 Tax=Indibacter alkaliphilus (strain CCUG 57479 / KCTC 22604 / LW1) TaxID=1189612 RepID=S2E620_INDAL|nr:NAD-binding protein [Indibacter alkaliphilus]EOZ97723.1 Trk system potassium uptake protein TrkA [Indibacter alkaliphilus LW1]